MFSLFVVLFKKYILGKDMQKYKYDVCYSSPKLNPVDVFIINFISDSGTLSASFGSASACGMGNGRNICAGSHDNSYYLPKAFEALWVSLVDKKVYSIAASLPYDELASLFKNKDGLNRLDMCFLPEGKMLLYAKGNGWKILLDWTVTAFEEKNEKLLDHIYLSRAKESMKHYFDWIYSGEINSFVYWQKYLREHGSPIKVLDRYLQKFNYMLNFEFEDNTTKDLDVWSPFVNGELRPSTLLNMSTMQARIKEIKSFWNTEKYHYTCYMYFNEEEMLRLFDEAYGDDKTQKGELTIKVGADCKSYDLSLNVVGKSYKLNKTEIRVFKDPIEDPNGDGTLIYKNYEGNHKNRFADDAKYVVD